MKDKKCIEQISKKDIIEKGYMIWNIEQVS
jgi:hypothetical protein